MRCKVVHQFACEIEKSKQTLLRKYLLPDPHCCLFADVTKLSNDEERHCVVHNNSCVPWHLKFQTGLFVNPFTSQFALFQG